MQLVLRHIAIPVLATLLLVGCRDFAVDSDGEDSAQFEGHLVASLEVPFEMQFGQRVILDETPLSVEFSLVSEDNRCGLNVQCVQAGRATVLLTVTDEQSVNYQLVAHIPGLVPTPYDFNDIIQFQGYRFRLLRVSPYPAEGEQPDMTEYSILLEVEPINVN
jgi:hypothetical protein